MRLKKYKFSIMVGDAKQLSPPSIRGTEESVFESEMNTPAHGRLQALGFPTASLHNQSRSAPEIGGISRNLVYQCNIRSTSATSLRMRPTCRTFREWVASTFRVAKSADLFLDVPKGPLNKISLMHGQSRTDMLFAPYGVNMAVDLLKKFFRDPGFPLSIITPNAAQRNPYLSAKASMQLDKVLNKSVDLDKLQIGTANRQIARDRPRPDLFLRYHVVGGATSYIHQKAGRGLPPESSTVNLPQDGSLGFRRSSSLECRHVSLSRCS